MLRFDLLQGLGTIDTSAQLYSRGFHDDRHARTHRAALEILGFLHRLVEFESLCDFGCGVGSWLAAAEEIGISDVRGYEGTWAREADMVVAPEIIDLRDLRQPIGTDRRFDLAMTLEVAEHLPEDRAATFVADLCAHSDLVLFSAAIPMQGGVGHINERWPSYWAEFFSGNGYDPFDIVRPHFWNERHIPFWYRQNTLVYAKRGSEKVDLLAKADPASRSLLDLVHPEQYEFAEAAQPKRAIARKVRQALGRG
ncbi:methyltransferase domain-containing protein [Qipengyuania sp. JC766]|uniref:methyltransferase domain-containing protein n=1 Tax=Qipengyuania sp. JC766 TaxID=3232139 RepID=UPI00345A1DDC